MITYRVVIECQTDDGFKYQREFITAVDISADEAGEKTLDYVRRNHREKCELYGVYDVYPGNIFEVMV